MGFSGFSASLCSATNILAHASSTPPSSRYTLSSVSECGQQAQRESLSRKGKHTTRRTATTQERSTLARGVAGSD